jgi:hypothetical protein
MGSGKRKRRTPRHWLGVLLLFGVKCGVFVACVPAAEMPRTQDAVLDASFDRALRASNIGVSSDVRVASASIVHLKRSPYYATACLIPLGFVVPGFKVSVKYDLTCNITWKGRTREFLCTASNTKIVIGHAPRPDRAFIDPSFGALIVRCREEASDMCTARIIKWISSE